MTKDSSVALLVQVPRWIRTSLKIEAARRESTITRLVVEAVEAALLRHGNGSVDA